MHYSVILTGAQLRRRGKASPAPFADRKNCPGIGKKGSDCVHYWVTFSIENVI